MVVLEKQAEASKPLLLSSGISKIHRDPSAISNNFPEDVKEQDPQYFMAQIDKTSSGKLSNFKLVCHECHSELIKED